MLVSSKAYGIHDPAVPIFRATILGEVLVALKGQVTIYLHQFLYPLVYFARTFSFLGDA